MLINQWYVLTESAAVGEEPVGVQALGQAFVIFRDAAGVAHCLSNVCIHKGGALCRGEVVAGTVQCPYHGWRFDGAGKCVSIPSLGPDRRIPKRARVDSYPVVERWGWMWAFLGDLPAAERPPLPDFYPEYASSDPDWRFIHRTARFECNWVRAIENGVDRGHAIFVHTDLGNPEEPVVADYEVTETEHSICSESIRRPLDKRGQWRDVIPDARSERKTEVHLFLPAPCIRIHMHMQPPMGQIIVTAYTPIDDYSTRLHVIHGRNFLTDPSHDDDTSQRLDFVIGEDAAVLNYLQPARVPPALGDELLLAADRHGTTFRRRVKAAEARGQAIDAQAMRAEDDQVRVIPSPRRREDPKNWLFKPVLMRPARVAPDIDGKASGDQQ